MRLVVLVLCDYVSFGLLWSARWDEDGDAGTRGPNDLVGRVTSKSAGLSVVLELQGRGLAGKFATQKLK